MVANSQRHPFYSAALWQGQTWAKPTLWGGHMSWDTNAVSTSSKTWPPSWSFQGPLPLWLSTNRSCHFGDLKCKAANAVLFPGPVERLAGR